MSGKVVIPEAMTRFKCNEQGCCCRGWTIPFRPDDVAKLAQHLPEAERTRIKRAVLIADEHTDEKQIVLEPVGPQKACTFLEESGSCEVHRRFGMEALPRICVNFPVVPYRSGDQIEMHFTLVCPEVLERLAESEDAYTIAELDADTVPHVRDRAKLLTGNMSVLMGGVQVPWAQLGAIRQTILRVIGDESRPVLEAVADVSYALGRIKSRESFEAFSVELVADRQAFYDFFADSIASHEPGLLARQLRGYRRFLFDLPRDGDAWGDALERGLADWEAPYRQWVLPTIPEWLLRRYLAHRYFTLFTNGAGELRFSYGSIVHTFALSCRLMAGLCAGFQRPVDVPIAKAAIGASEYFHRQLESRLPPEAMPWFAP